VRIVWRRNSIEGARFGRSTYETVVERHGYGVLPCFRCSKLLTGWVDSSGGVGPLFNLSRKVVGSSSEVLGGVVGEVEIEQEEKGDAGKRNRGGYVASSTCPALFQASTSHLAPAPAPLEPCRQKFLSIKR
jgi:hypothetical protein